MSAVNNPTKMTSKQQRKCGNNFGKQKEDDDLVSLETAQSFSWETTVFEVSFDNFQFFQELFLYV